MKLWYFVFISETSSDRLWCFWNKDEISQFHCNSLDFNSYLESSRWHYCSEFVPSFKFLFSYLVRHFPHLCLRLNHSLCRLSQLYIYSVRRKRIKNYSKPFKTYKLYFFKSMTLASNAVEIPRDRESENLDKHCKTMVF